MLAKIHLLWLRFAGCWVIAASPQTHVRTRSLEFTSDLDMYDLLSDCFISFSPSVSLFLLLPSANALSHSFSTIFSYTGICSQYYTCTYICSTTLCHTELRTLPFKIKHVCKLHIYRHKDTVKSIHTPTHRLKLTLISTQA